MTNRTVVEPAYLSLKNASRYVNASIHTLKLAIAVGELVAYKTKSEHGQYRIRVADLEAWMRRYPTTESA